MFSTLIRVFGPVMAAWEDIPAHDALIVSSQKSLEERSPLTSHSKRANKGLHYVPWGKDPLERIHPRERIEGKIS